MKCHRTREVAHHPESGSSRFLLHLSTFGSMPISRCFFESSGSNTTSLICISAAGLTSKLYQLSCRESAEFGMEVAHQIRCAE